MASPLLEEEGLLREWGPLTDLLRQIPAKAQRGIFTQDLYLTCVDVVPEFIAVGTNLGLVYWYNRKTGDLQRLRCEDASAGISCVKIVSTVEFMVAAGSDVGAVTVFQVPKSYPDGIPDSLKPKGKQVERYTISGLHSAPISAVEWSRNGMKLFSGDKNGLVVLTEMDFYMHLSKSAELLNEKYEVVQLSYCRQLLLVSTLYRSIVCHRDDRWRVAQVGQKERKTLGKLGATFWPLSGSTQNLLVYSSRPGLRLWRADKDGVVQQTLIYKDALAAAYPEVPLLTPSKLRHTDHTFGPLLCFRDNLLVTYSDHLVYVLNPASISVVAAVTELRGVVDVAVGLDEILVLEGGRSLLRLSFAPEPQIESQEEQLTSSLLDAAVVPAIPLQTLLPHLPTLGIVNQEWNPIVTADEAIELPPVVTISMEGFIGLHIEEEGNAAQQVCEERARLYDKIGEQSFENILFKPKTKKKSSKKKHVPSGAESGSDTMSTNSVRSNNSDCEDIWSSSDGPRTVSQDAPDKPDILHHLNTSGNLAIKPDLRSPASIERDVADKEKILARVLHLDTLCLDHSKDEETCLDNSSSEETRLDNSTAEDICLDQLRAEEIRLEHSRAEEIRLGHSRTDEICLDHLRAEEICLDHPRAESTETSGDYGMEDSETNQEMLSFGPPSGSSRFASLEIYPDVKVNDKAVEQADKWVMYKMPDHVSSMAVCRNYICCVDGKEHVYYSQLSGFSLRWQKLDYRATHVAFSLNGCLVCKLTKDVAWILTSTSGKGPFGGEWREVARGIAHVAVNDATVWLVTLDGLLLACSVFGTCVPVACPWRLIRVSCHSNTLWALTAEREVITRTGMSTTPTGQDWRRLVTPGLVIQDFAVGDITAGWLLDQHGKVHYTSDFAAAKPVWWEVLVSDYVFRSSSTLPNLRDRRLMLAVGHHTVWIADKVAAAVHTNKVEFAAHRWSKVSLKYWMPSTRWQQISAEGVFENKGQLWLLSSAGDLFCSSPSSDNLMTLGLPSDSPIACLAAAPLSLWLLSAHGCINVRQGLTDTCADGTAWRQLSLEQISGVHLTHVSCGCDVVWACDRHGDVYMAVGSPHSISTSTFSPVWIKVEPRKHVFTKVYVGPHLHMVWALDSKGNVFVREGIFNDFQLGTDWVAVSGIQATQLSVTGSVVWALVPSGAIYRRLGISEHNYIGDYWQKVPGSATVITASVSEGLWAVGKNEELLRHEQLSVRLGPVVTTHAANRSETIDDWELID